MSREEVLRRLEDEKDLDVAGSQGRKAGYIAFVCVFIVFVIASLSLNQMAVFYAVSTLFWAFFSAVEYAKYYYLRNRKYRLRAFLGTLVFFVSAYNALLSMLGL